MTAYANIPKIAKKQVKGNLSNESLKQVKRAVEVYFFADLELVFGFGHVIEQKFQDDGAAEAAAFDFKVAEPLRGVHVLDVVDSDKAGVFHGIGEAIAAPCIRRDTNVVFLSFAEVLLAHVLVALFAVLAAEPAAFIAQEFDFLLLRNRQRVQLGNLLVESEIRHHVTKFVAVQFTLELGEICQHLRGRRNEIESRILRLDVIEQQIRMNDDAARSRSVFLKEGAQGVAFFVGKMFFTEQGIAEGQARRNAVFLGECGNGLGLRITKSDATSTPQAIAGRTVNGADFTPLVKEFPMLAEQRQECLVKVIKFEQSGKVVENAHHVKYTYFYFAHLPYFNYITIISELRNSNSELSYAHFSSF